MLVWYALAAGLIRIADGCVGVAVVVLALQRTNSPAAAGLVVSAYTLPALASGPLKFRPKPWNAAQFDDTLDGQIDLDKTPMSAVMTRNGKTIGPRVLAAEAVHLMEVHRITALPVADESGRVVGALNVHDLFRAGVM